MTSKNNYLLSIISTVIAAIILYALYYFEFISLASYICFVLVAGFIIFSLRKSLPNMLRSYLINASGILFVFIIFNTLVFREIVSRYWGSLFIFICINIIMATSLNFSTGFLGQLILGHAGFMAIGAYTAGMIGIQLVGLGVPNLITLIVCLLIGGLFASIVSVIIGIPALRLKGDYLGIMTLAFGEIVRVILNNIKITGGAQGLPGIPRLTNFTNAFFVMVACVAFLVLVGRSRHGRSIISIRENEIASEAVGVNSTKYKVTGLAISAFIGGIGGGLYAFQLGYLQPLMFGFLKSVDILIMVVLGGMGSITGSVLAAGVFTWLPEALREVDEYRMVAYGILLIVMMIVRPQGIFGTQEMSFASKILKKYRNRKQGGAK